MQPQEVAEHAAELMLEKKAKDVVILDLRGLSGATDYFVIGSAENEVQVKAISESVVSGLESAGNRIYHLEGFSERRWVLLDCIDIVVHIFLEELREFYGLERLWGDAPLERRIDKE